MDSEFWFKVGTLFCSFIASCFGVLNWWTVHRGRVDKFIVGLYSVRPELSPGTVMHVISCSDHPINIIDYGFIYEDGEIESIPFSYELGVYFPDNAIHFGSTVLEKRGDYFERGLDIQFSKQIIGSFAKSATQTTRQLYFMHNRPILDRILFWNKRRKLLNSQNA